MRWCVLIFFGLVMSGLAEELEVRKYRLSEGELGMVLQAKGLGAGQGFGNPQKPGFESRFFAEGGTWVDCSKQIAAILFEEEFTGVAMMDREKGVMVMKAEGWDHDDFAEMVRESLPAQIGMKVVVYRLTGVVAGMRPMGFAKVPEGGKLLGEISVSALPGQTAESRTLGGEMSVETEMQFDRRDEILEARINLSGKLKGTSFSLKTGFMTPFGMPWVHEFGSLDGKETLMAVITTELVLMDGSPEDLWVEKEKGGAFLREERFQRMRRGEMQKLKGEFRKYTVPPTLPTFLGTAGSQEGDDPDPFAVEVEDKKPSRLKAYQRSHRELAGAGVVYDMKELLQQNGLSFREGDFAVFSKSRSCLYAQLSLEQHFLLEGIVCHHDGVLARMIRVDLEQVDQEGRILKKLGGLALPGQSATFSLGDDLKLQVEAQIDANDEIVEARVTLAEVGGDLEKPTIKTGMVLRDGAPMVIQKSFVGEQKSWRMTATIVALDEVVDVYLKSLDR